MMTVADIESLARAGAPAGGFRPAGARNAYLPRPVRPGMPAADMIVSPGQITVRADLPGIPAENVEVTVTSRFVEIVGWPTEDQKDPTYNVRERQRGVLRRTLSLPEEAVARRSRATLRAGVIEIRIPRTPMISGWSGRRKEA